MNINAILQVNIITNPLQWGMRPHRQEQRKGTTFLQDSFTSSTKKCFS